MNIPPDYTPHDGKGRPKDVGPLAVVTVVFNDARHKRRTHAKDITWDWWANDPEWRYVTAYKVITPDPADALAEALKWIAENDKTGPVYYKKHKDGRDVPYDNLPGIFAKRAQKALADWEASRG